MLSRAHTHTHIHTYTHTHTPVHCKLVCLSARSGNLSSPRSSRASKGTPKPQLVGTTATAPAASHSAHEASTHDGSAGPPQHDISPPLSSVRGSQMPPPQGILLGGGARGHPRTSPHVRGGACEHTSALT
eukprot:1157282-Pelagomonas_calceolata.AAC.11